ncbi:MAG TPA: type II toxin-antitoxin system prevent-host-death family antitoxin [Candidatus Limnocylindrales bacterium]|nr:type II toxin-antitoxin system prevent-host-death family antitoxin [Candidatus Limnocylindrales bacterium]
MVETVNIHEAKTHLSRLIDKVEAGEEIVIARAGRLVARRRGLARPGVRLVRGTRPSGLNGFSASD